MLRLTARRIALGLLTLLAASVVVFAATQLLLGDAARAILGRDATPARLAEVRAQLHLNDSAPDQYWSWLSGIFSGDLGTSLANGQPVGSFIGGRIGNTAFLVAISALIAVPLSMLLGVIAAVRRDKPIDQLVTIGSTALAALPEFVTAIVLTLLLSTVVVHAFPAVSIIPPGSPPWSNPKLIVLPALTLTLAVLPYITRMVRGTMVEVLESDYIEMARLKGVRGSMTIIRHALPNIAGPASQAIGLALAYLAGGAVVVEYVFAYPGVGQGLVNAVTERDVPVIQALTLLLAASYVTFNLIADIVTYLLTPRARTSVR
jgi:peptide/nickel transport system permease protein